MTICLGGTASAPLRGCAVRVYTHVPGPNRSGFGPSQEVNESRMRPILGGDSVYFTRDNGYSLLQLKGDDDNGDDNVWFIPVHSISRDEPRFDLTAEPWPVGVEVAPLPTALSLFFDGASAYLRTSLTNLPGDSFTVETYFQLGDNGGANQTLFYDEAITNYTLLVNGGATSNHLARATYSEGNLYFGLDASSSNNPGYFSGNLDDIRVWNRALTQVEITSNLFVGFLHGAETNTQLAAYYPVEDGVQRYRFGWLTNAYSYPAIALASQLGSLNTTYARRGVALDFGSSVNSRMSIDDGRWFSGDSYTVECWVKPHSLTATAQVFDFGNADSANRVSLQILTNGLVCYGVYLDATHSRVVTSSTALAHREGWNHLALVVSNGLATLYLDGKTNDPSVALGGASAIH